MIYCEEVHITQRREPNSEDEPRGPFGEAKSSSYSYKKNDQNKTVSFLDFSLVRFFISRKRNEQNKGSDFIRRNRQYSKE